MEKRRLPIGTDNFIKLRQNNLYYVDKTGLIRELLESWSEVTLFTRPRRFGKTLNTSMLKAFFEIGTDKRFFDGLAISQEKEICEQYLGKFPVISISLKTVDAADYDSARLRLWNVIREEAERFAVLLQSERLDELDKENFTRLRKGEGNLEESLLMLSRILCKHYDKKVIILIDEYDVPLDRAARYEYYDRMIILIRTMFSAVLKSNDYLQFAVLTGCMRISKESLFSDLNNLKVYSIVDNRFDEWFGFTDAEVRKMLDDYELTEYYEQTKEWYDGYRMGQQDVYCPWDVINWCDKLINDTNHDPENFWANTSGDDRIVQFVDMADDATKRELERLSAGESIEKNLKLNLTYNELGSSINHFWSVLFTAGYLTQCGKNEYGEYKLVIPNKEINHVFDQQIKRCFYQKIGSNLKTLYKAFSEGNAQTVEEQLNASMQESISFMDGGNSDEQKESFYHGLLLGMLKDRSGWKIRSNREAGNGRADIIVSDQLHNSGYIIEVKYAKDAKSEHDKTALSRWSDIALRQIDSQEYHQYFEGEDVQHIFRYGIAFYKKICVVKTQ
ncbi:MAG: ATP-binding protein [Lachnospiraceae bacterium]|nr:ATP-binding protein [Lachnospiraceae bacterium]